MVTAHMQIQNKTFFALFLFHSNYSRLFFISLLLVVGLAEIRDLKESNGFWLSSDYKNRRCEFWFPHSAEPTVVVVHNLKIRVLVSYSRTQALQAIT